MPESDCWSKTASPPASWLPPLFLNQYLKSAKRLRKISLASFLILQQEDTRALPPDSFILCALLLFRKGRPILPKTGSPFCRRFSRKKQLGSCTFVQLPSCFIEDVLFSSSGFSAQSMPLDVHRPDKPPVLPLQSGCVRSCGRSKPVCLHG